VKPDVGRHQIAPRGIEMDDADADLSQKGSINAEGRP
jgi:hypothetical protein